MTLTLQLNDELESILNEVDLGEDAAGRDCAVIVEAVCGLYTRGRVGAGKAAQLLGISRLEFLDELAKRKIPVNYGCSELEEDIQFDRRQ